MDGREFVNMPPLGLPLEPGRVSSGTTGGRLLPSTGQLPPFCTAKYFPTPLGLHSQPGFPHLGRAVYHSYIPLSHLESSTSGSPLLTHMGPRNVIEPPKDGFCFSAPLSTYHPRPNMGKSLTNQTHSSRLNENDAMCHSYKNSREASKDSKERFCRNELLCNTQLMSTAKKDGRISGETFSCDMGDYDLETKVEKERKKSGLPRVPKIGDHVSSFISEQALIHWSGSNEKSTHNRHNSLSSCNQGSNSFVNSLGSEDDKCVKDASRHDENVRTLLPAGLNRTKHGDSAVTPATTLNMLCSCSSLHPSNTLCKIGSSSPVPAQSLHTSMYNKLKSKDSDKIKTIIAPTYEPQFEVSKEQNNATHIHKQIYDFKGKDFGKLDEKSEVSYSNFLQEVSNNEPKKTEVFRVKGSVICCNSSIKSQGVSDSLIDTPALNSLEKRTFVSMKDSDTHCRQSEHSKEKCKISGFLDSHQHTGHSIVNLPEQKVKHSEISDFRSSPMDGLSAQHFTSHGKEEAKKLCSETKTMGSNKALSDFTYPLMHSEGCAMQSLIKYSGNFEKEAAFWKSGDKKNPFGGLGNLRLDESQVKAAKGQSVSHQDVKRDPDRPGSTKSFTKETVGFQGEVEVRNPPVGIAVAVARQKDNNGNKSISSKGHTNEENGDEQIRNCNDRVLIQRMDREHAALLRENKDLPDISPIHPAGCAAIGLSSNLMVTGGPALTGPWTSDSTSHLTTHPWISSGVLPCMWHADNPYGLTHPSLHQGINPAVPPGMPASFPSPYSFARDPQNGQIVVIPAEHLSNFAEILDRTSSLWPSMYSSAHSSLQHARQLQLFSQQQLMRQHELYMLLQQQAVHSIDLHRSAQLEALESQRNEQVDTMDLQRNAQLDILEMQRSAQMEMKELHRRSHFESQRYQRNENCMEPAKSEERIVEYTSETRHPSPICSSGSVQKKVISQTSSISCDKEFDLSPIPLKLFPLPNKSEKILHQGCDIHTSKNPDLHPTFSATILPTKVEDSEELAEDMNIKQDSSSPNEDTTQGFPFQSLSPSVHHHLSYLSQSHEVSDEESFVPIVKQPELSTESSELHLNSRSLITNDFETSEEIDGAIKVEDVSTVACGESLQDESGSCTVPVECQKGLVQEIKSMEMEENDHNSVENITSCISRTNLRNRKETCSTQTDFNYTLNHDENFKMNMIVVPQGILPPHTTNEMIDCNAEISKDYTEGDTDRMFSCNDENVQGGLTAINCADVKTEDPLAGMNVLVAATEMPEASSLHPMDTVILTPDITLDHTLLHGIILLSEMAELEMEKRKQVNSLQSYHVRPSLESLLAASTQMLMEVLSSPDLDGLKPESIKLPRELSHNKKYSWKQEKDNPPFYLTSAIEVMDSVEMDCRVRLAELQRRYKEKQRELAKLQRKRDSEDKVDERSKTLSRRGPGRPKKRKHGTSPLFYKEERMRNCNNRRLEKRVLLSESSKTGVFFRRSLMNVSDVDEMENGTGDFNSLLHGHGEHDRVSGYMYEAQSIFKKKRKSSIQDHLINTLDTALSLTKQSKEKSCFKFTNHNGRKQRDTRNLKNISPSDFKQMCSIQLSRSMSKEDTDTDEDDNNLRNEWSSQSRPLQYSMCSMLSRKLKNFERSPSPERISSCYRTGKLKSVSRNKQFRLLLMDREAGLSFSDSTEDSFDQGY